MKILLDFHYVQYIIIIMYRILKKTEFYRERKMLICRTDPCNLR